MKRTKLMSIRLEDETIAFVEKFVANNKYYKKSNVINNILRAVLDNFTEGEIYDMVERWKWSRNVVYTNFEVTKDLKPYKRQ